MSQKDSKPVSEPKEVKMTMRTLIKKQISSSVVK